jgi:acyl-CoA-binding protein
MPRISRRYLCISKNIQKEFDDAVASLSNLKTPPSNEVKLKLYALFKQANTGNCNVDSPSIFDPVGRAKYNAWKSLENMDKVDAMKAYVETVLALKPKSDDSSAQSSQTNQVNNGNSNRRSLPTVSSVAFPRKQTSISKIQYDTISTELNDGVALIKLNRPDYLNAFNMPMWSELIHLFDDVNHDSSVKAVILTGSSKSFSTGMVSSY